MKGHARMVALLAALCTLAAGGEAQGETAPRGSLSAGMGVSYLAPKDIVALVNVTAIPSERLSQFHAAGEFFGAAAYPLSQRWMLKAEYAYLTWSTTVDGGYGQADFGLTVHMPSVILQYIIVDEGSFDVKCGAGGGYHFGSYSEKYSYLSGESYTAKGPGFVLEMEANTAFGDHLEAFLGGNIRWSFIGTLTNAEGMVPGRNADGSTVTMNFFGAGARLGLSYFF